MIAVAALAAASLVVGSGPHNAGTAILKPGTLRVQCKLPRHVESYDVSPNGKYLAVGDAKGLHIRDARFCQKLDDFRIRTSQRVISWVTDDRILIVKRGRPTTVRAFDPFGGEVVHRERLAERLGDTARVGDRQVTLTAVKSGDEQTLRVFDADGAIERTVPLPGMREGVLHGSSPIADTALVFSDDAKLIYAVDVRTGEAVKHEVDIPDDYATWVEPQIPGMLAVGAYDTVSILDPETFAVKRVVHPGSQIKGAGAGFISVADDGEAPLRAYDGNGDLLWSHKLDLLDASAFGGRVYAGSGYHHVRIRVFDLATGKRQRVIRGRAFLFEASHGRVAVPYLTNQAIVED